MKKNLFLLFAFAALCVNAAAFMPVHIAGGGGTAGSPPENGTDYTAHANCQAAYFMNGATTETDRSGNGYTLTPSTDDTIPTSTDVPPGYSGTSRDFEVDDTEHLSINDASCPNIDFSGADNYTACAWIKIETAPSAGSYRYILGKYGESMYKQWGMRIEESEGSIYPRFIKSSDGTISQSAQSYTSLSTGTWYHLCGVYDHVNMEIWVNGTRMGYTATTNNTGSEDMPFRIGDRDLTGGEAGYWFDGLIDEVIIFDTNLGSTEINEIKTYGIDGTKGSND